MEEQESWQEWDLSGLSVTQLRLDHAFSVHLWSLDRDLLVRFGTPFTFRPASGETVMIDPENVSAVVPVLSVLHQPAATFRVSSADRCELRMADGSKLSSERHPDFESWESRGSGDLESASWLAQIA